MNKIIRTAAAIVMAAMLVTGAFAQGGKAAPKAKHKAAAAVVCPVCKMPLSAKKTKANPVAVRLKKGGKIMYCCAACKMPDSVLVKPGKAKAKAKGRGKGK